mgnify:CR=1 FL=1
MAEKKSTISEHLIELRSRILKSIIFITLSFLTGRILGLLLDGSGPIQTYMEIIFEIALITLGLFLLKRTKGMVF